MIVSTKKIHLIVLFCSGDRFSAYYNATTKPVNVHFRLFGKNSTTIFLLYCVWFKNRIGALCHNKLVGLYFFVYTHMLL